MWFVVKQTASDLKGGGGGCIHSASSERQCRECQPASSDGVAQGLWPLCLQFLAASYQSVMRLALITCQATMQVNQPRCVKSPPK